MSDFYLMANVRNPHNGVKILLLDIETFPIEAFVWGIYEQNIGVNQIKEDWVVASWAAKWYGQNKIFYNDQSKKENKRDDKDLLVGIWNFIGQNSVKFDVPKLFARFIKNKMRRPSPFQQIDTRKLARKTFGFTSNSLEYLCTHLGVEKKKVKSKKFIGQDLWTECLKGNQEAWQEMKAYNIRDVEALEDIYDAMIPWYNPLDFRVFNPKIINEACPTCSGKNMQKRGVMYTKSGKFQRYQCKDCGTWTHDKGAKNNIMFPEKRASLRKGG
jgi:DNA polymerase III epsilon subunit-like protein